MSTFIPGTTVEASKGNATVRGMVVSSNSIAGPYWYCLEVPELGWTGDSARYLHWLANDGWTLSSVTPPLAPGVYLPYLQGDDTERVPNLWVLDRDKGWLSIGNTWTSAPAKLTPKKIAEITSAPVRLEAERITARKVLSRIEERYGEDYFHNENEGWNDIAREFGVTK